MFETSAETDKLDAALAKAQMEIKPSGKSGMNPHLRKKYADLVDVWEACHEALAKNGISVTQWPENTAPGRLGIITRLACEGQWMKGSFDLPVGKDDEQAYGKTLTYGKRFGLAAAVGVVSSEDDDATNRDAITQDHVAVQKENVRQIQNHAPGGVPKAVPANTQKPAVQPRPNVIPKSPATGDTEFETYRVDFGKHDGKTLREIGPLEARKYLDWLIESAGKDNKPMSDSAMKFQQMFHRWQDLMQAQKQ